MFTQFNEENLINPPRFRKEKIKKIIIVDDNDDVYVINTSSEKSNIVIENKSNSASYYNPDNFAGYDIRLYASAKEYTIIENEGKMIMDGIKSFLDDKIKKINNIKKLF